MDNGSVAQGRSIAFSPSHVSVTRAPFICLHSRWWYVSNTSSGIGTLDRPYPPTSAEWTPTQVHPISPGDGFGFTLEDTRVVRVVRGILLQGWIGRGYISWYHSDPSSVTFRGVHVVFRYDTSIGDRRGDLVDLMGRITPARIVTGWKLALGHEAMDSWCSWRRISIQVRNFMRFVGSQVARTFHPA